MTHDELVDIAIVKDLNKLIRKQMKAIDAVFELHKPFLYPEDDKIYCDECNVKYPCKTIQAIEKELAL